VCNISEKKLQCLDTTLYRGTKNAFINSLAVYSTCCDLGFVCGLLACGLIDYATEPNMHKKHVSTAAAVRRFKADSQIILL
jgi:hypothetical protein